MLIGMVTGTQRMSCGGGLDLFFKFCQENFCPAIFGLRDVEYMGIEYEHDQWGGLDKFFKCSFLRFFLYFLLGVFWGLGIFRACLVAEFGREFRDGCFQSGQFLNTL